MDLSLSAEQVQLRETAAAYLAKATPDDDGAWDPAGWQELARLGWLDTELTLLDEVVLLEESAAALLPAPLFSTRLVIPVLDARTRAAVEAGAARVGLAWAEPRRSTGFTDAVGSSTSLDAERVTGRKVLVPDADKVDRFVVVTGGSHPAVSLVAAADASIATRSTSDLSRSLSDVELARAPATPLELACDVVETLAVLQRRAYVLSAAEALGVGARALDLALQHARDRTQFGRPIGAYQAVSHQLVDAHIELELGRSLTYWAADCVTSGHAQQAAATAAAKAQATTAAVRACETAIQVSGGQGMTWEHPLHRLYKRAQWLDAYLAGARALYAEVADFVFPTGSTSIT